MLADDIRAAARRFGAATVMVTEDASLSYADLHARSDRVAAAMWRRGVRTGDRVVLRLPSGIPYLLAYAAAAKLGAAVAGINSGLATSEQQRLVAVADPALVIDAVGDVVALEGAGHPSGVPDVAPDPARLVALVFTSGTTGTPRAAMFTEQQLAAAMSIESHRSLTKHPGQPSLLATHFAHVGPTTKLPWYLRRGIRLHVLSRWRASDVLRVVADQRIAEIGAIPPQVALMLQAPEIEQLDLSCLRCIIAGGAASAPGLIHRARAMLGCDYVVRYSSTESGGVGLGTSVDDPDEALGAIGRPRHGVVAQIRDGDGVTLPPGQVGELYLRSAAVMSGYWRDEEATATTLVGGWLRTGDLAVRNPNGTYTLKGRLKEMYIRGGYNVYPAEVEAVLAGHPAVDACAVIPRADATMGEVGVAVIVLKPRAMTVNLNDVRTFLDGRIARWKQPEDVIVVDELPLNGTHKADRRALSEIVARHATATR